MAERIKDRYLNGFVTDDQLDKYVKLGILTKKEAASIKASKNAEV